MSIIIKSLDSLPEHCFDCPCHEAESGYCQADKKHRYSDYRPFWCPLQQISNTYYGRLIRFNDIQITTVPIFKDDKAHYEGIAFLKQILEIPPVEAIPISAIEEMKSRISELNEFSKDEIDELYMQDVIKIIDECCGIIETDKEDEK